MDFEHEKEILIGELERVYSRGFTDGMAYAESPSDTHKHASAKLEYGSIMQKQSHDYMRYAIDRLIWLGAAKLARPNPSPDASDGGGE